MTAYPWHEKGTKREYPEFKECRKFVKNIRETIKVGKAPNLIHFFHNANEGKNNGHLVNIGLLPGLADYTFVYWKKVRTFDGAVCVGTESYNTIAYIEFKAPGEKLKPEQETFRRHCVDSGIPYLLAYETGRAVRWLIEIGVLEE